MLDVGALIKRIRSHEILSLIDVSFELALKICCYIHEYFNVRLQNIKVILFLDYFV